MSRDDDLWRELHATRNWRYEQHESDALNASYAGRTWAQWRRNMWAWRIAFAVMLVVLTWAAFNSDRHVDAPHYPTHQPTTETTR